MYSELLVATEKIARRQTTQEAKGCRQSANLKEAISMVEFGKLLRVKTIAQEEAIVQDIARIIAQSQ
ncbi:hypothetical protein V6N13_115990 [Hibiscus sabdariffa]